jgi:hypothetical protein
LRWLLFFLGPLIAVAGAFSLPVHTEQSNSSRLFRLRKAALHDSPLR